jgi:hypothetical protein
MNNKCIIEACAKAYEQKNYSVEWDTFLFKLLEYDIIYKRWMVNKIKIYYE